MKKLALLALFCSAGFAADLTGSWACEVQFEGGTGSPRFEFTQTGEALKGKYSGQLGEAEVAGKVTGDKAAWSLKVEIGVIEYDGTVAGNEIKGKVDLGGQATGTFTCKKSK
jgi:hypothetical protein